MFDAGVLDFTVFESAVPREMSTFESLWTHFPWMSLPPPDHELGRFFDHFSVSVDGFLCS